MTRTGEVDGAERADTGSVVEQPGLLRVVRRLKQKNALVQKSLLIVWAGRLSRRREEFLHSRIPPIPGTLQRPTTSEIFSHPGPTDVARPGTDGPRAECTEGLDDSRRNSRQSSDRIEQRNLFRSCDALLNECEKADDAI